MNENKKRVMISQPMNGLTKEQVMANKQLAVSYLESLGYEVVETFFSDEWSNPENMAKRGIRNIPLCFMAKSIEAMSTCDAVLFLKGWQEARGCVIENTVALKYGLDVIYEE